MFTLQSTTVRLCMMAGLLMLASSTASLAQDTDDDDDRRRRWRPRFENRPIGVHDPVMIKEGDTYYMFTTGRGISIHTSNDMMNWEDAGRVFEESPEWPRRINPRFRGHIWAPDIAKIGDRYCLYYSCSSFGSRNSAIGLVTNTTLDASSPEYEWVDQGLVIESNENDNDWNAIDPNAIQDADGQWWLSWGSWWGGHKLVKLDAETGKPPRNFPTLHSIAERRSGLEAPFIVRRGDFYYQFVSWDNCCRGVDSTYNIRVGRATEVTGPYYDADGTDMMDGGGTLVLEGYDHVRGPGHNAVYIEDGVYYLVHHYYDARFNGQSTLHIRPMSWTDEGWPVAGQPLKEWDDPVLVERDENPETE